MPDAEVIRVGNATNVLLKYNWYLNSTDNKTTIDLGLQSAKKYWRYATQIADQLLYLQDFLLALAVFIKKAYINYD